MANENVEVQRLRDAVNCPCGSYIPDGPAFSFPLDGFYTHLGCGVRYAIELMAKSGRAVPFERVRIEYCDDALVSATDLIL